MVPKIVSFKVTLTAIFCPVGSLVLKEAFVVKNLAEVLVRGTPDQLNEFTGLKTELV